MSPPQPNTHRQKVGDGVHDIVFTEELYLHRLIRPEHAEDFPGILGQIIVFTVVAEEFEGLADLVGDHIAFL